MRKSISIFILTFLLSSSIHAQLRLQKLWETDTTSFKGPESATYDPISNKVYVSSMNNGNIAILNPDGKIVSNNWATGLTANKGIGFYNGILFTAETNSVAAIDMQTGKIIKRISIDGSIMLNDLEVDNNGIVYVSDTRAGKVYKIVEDKPVVFLENISGANGLMAVGTDLYIVGSSTFQRVNSNKEFIKIGEGYESGLDGIVMLSPNEFILSNYRGMIYYVDLNGNKQVLQDTRDIKLMCNDISYDSKTNTLFVPSFSSNKVTAYLVKH
jgi:DNA-binding beta-propeller fold protein YncE